MNLILWIIWLLMETVLTGGKSTGDPFQPIKLRTEFSNEIKSNTSLLIQLDDIFAKSVQKVSSLLSVRHSNKSLHFKRKNACKNVWRNGPNKNKCSQIRWNYKGEYCSSNDEFKIPEEHLEGIDIYNFSHPLPLENSIPFGAGIWNVDLILYVYMKHNTGCLNKGTIAHASYCRVDEYMRPIAGYVNICPLSWKFLTSHDVQMNVIIHEVFHVLGFSKQSFVQLQRLYGKNYVAVDRQGITRLRLPSLIQKMQLHFNCNLDDFGGPLPSQMPEISSGGLHWHPKLLPGTIMNPEIYMQSEVLIDKFTLSVFEDTQWYKVNYSLADDYILGEGLGCNLNELEWTSRISTHGRPTSLQSSTIPHSKIGEKFVRNNTANLTSQLFSDSLPVLKTPPILVLSICFLISCSFAVEM